MRVRLDYETQMLAQSGKTWLEPLCKAIEKHYEPTFSIMLIYVTSGVVKFEAHSREGHVVSQAVGFPAIWTSKPDALVRFLVYKLKKKLPYQSTPVWTPSTYLNLPTR